MKVLIYNDIDYSGLEQQFNKVVSMIEKDDFKSAEVKKIGDSLYRAKLNYADRLLFQLYVYDNVRYAMIIEVIRNHAYNKSRFLNGAVIDEEKIPLLLNPNDIKTSPPQLNYLNANSHRFNILNKILSFDDSQNKIFHTKTPLIIIGSAGSGKSVLALEKLKLLHGEGLYITLSPFLAENARNLYYSNNYFNDKQNIDFLSFKEFLETIKVPTQKEFTAREFYRWFSNNRQSLKIKESNKLYEEFNGVISGSTYTKKYLSCEEYVSLGVKRSIFLHEERKDVYDIFLKYLKYLETANFYDPNILSYDYLELCEAKYDFLIIDEVQDLTNSQLNLILKSLKNKHNFVLCGDSNQIVQPNFFAWSNVKTLFYDKGSDETATLIRILNTNYRNSKQIITLANKILLLKNERFGSIDKESNYLVSSNSSNEGHIELLSDSAAIKTKLNSSTARSTKYAVIVLKEEYKADAARFFSTPLIFSIQEAKGLEYENIILYNFISNCSAEFDEITENISEDYAEKELKYSRNKDKSDKSLEAYKFYINSLYVAITRSISNLFVIEEKKNHRALSLLKLTDFKEQTGVKAEISNKDEWKHEARKLELQGKKDQADAIKKTILGEQQVPWEILTPDKLNALYSEAFDPAHFNNQAKIKLFEYALYHHIPYIFDKLVQLKFNKAAGYLERQEKELERKFCSDYLTANFSVLIQKLNKYGVDFRDKLNFTPLMNAVKAGRIDIVNYLIAHDADITLRNSVGMQAQHIALKKGFADQHYAQKYFGEIYRKVELPGLKVKILDKMIKLDSSQMPFFILNMMFAAQSELMKDKAKYAIPAFQAGDFEKALNYFPEYIVPEYRKRRAYISSILSANEVYRDNISKMLFIRVRTGYYMINPLLEIETEEGWMNANKLMLLDEHYKNSPMKIHQDVINYLEKSKMRIEESVKNKGTTSFTQQSDNS